MPRRSWKSVRNFVGGSTDDSPIDRIASGTEHVNVNGSSQTTGSIGNFACNMNDTCAFHPRINSIEHKRKALWRRGILALRAGDRCWPRLARGSRGTRMKRLLAGSFHGVRPPQLIRQGTSRHSTLARMQNIIRITENRHATVFIIWQHQNPYPE